MIHKLLFNFIGINLAVEILIKISSIYLIEFLLIL